MIPAFAYLRVSGSNQIKGHGFLRQQETISGFAKAKYKILDVYKEQAVSGTTDETQRPAFGEMVQAMLTNGCRTVLVESMDRLAREYRIQEHLLIYLAAKGIELVNCATAENVTKAIQDDPMKKALVQMQGIFAELDKSLLVRKLKKARDSIRKVKGKCEGRKKYGEISEDEKAIMKRIYYLRRKPKEPSRRRRSYQKIADILNGEGIPTRTGKRWSSVQVWRIASHQ